MNNRIQELAQQAGLRFTQLMSNPMVPVVDGKETDLEKFAELIINECISAVEDTNDRHRRDYFAAKIKQHFGIQE